MHGLENCASSETKSQRIARAVFILLLGFRGSFELGRSSYFLCRNQPFWNLKAELKPFLTIFGTGMMV
jgi:hypothetical protein